MPLTDQLRLPNVSISLVYKTKFLSSITKREKKYFFPEKDASGLYFDKNNITECIFQLSPSFLDIVILFGWHPALLSAKLTSQHASTGLRYSCVSKKNLREGPGQGDLWYITVECGLCMFESDGLFEWSFCSSSGFNATSKQSPVLSHIRAFAFSGFCHYAWLAPWSRITFDLHPYYFLCCFLNARAIEEKEKYDLGVLQTPTGIRW